MGKHFPPWDGPPPHLNRFNQILTVFENDRTYGDSYYECDECNDADDEWRMYIWWR